MVGRMGVRLYYLVKIEFKMSKIPPITNLKKTTLIVYNFVGS